MNLGRASSNFDGSGLSRTAVGLTGCAALLLLTGAVAGADARIATVLPGLGPDRPYYPLALSHFSQPAEMFVHYAIEDVARAEVVQRGFSQLEGIERDGVILRP